MMNPLWVAELGSNHNGDVGRALKLVDAAEVTGFGAVKVQAFRADRLYRSVAKREEVRRFELSTATIKVLCEVAQKKGLKFGVSVFDIETLKELVDEIHIDFFKIASYSLLDLNLIRAVAAIEKPLMIGTGMATVDEMTRAWSEAFKSGSQPTMLHCVSNYPTPYTGMNLRAMEYLSGKRGLSDHSKSLAVVLRAVHRWNAQVIELHFDVNGEGFEAEHSWNSSNVQYAMTMVKMGLEADGSGQKPLPSECEERKWRADPSDGLRPIVMGPVTV